MKIRSIPLVGISLLVAAIASGCIVVDLNGCGQGTVKGSGNVVTEERPVAEFKTITLKGGGRVVLTQGQTHSIAIQTDDNIMSLIETEVQNEQLVISQGDYNLRPTTLEFNISVANLRGIAISGSGEVVGKSRFVSEDFFAKISGSGDCKVTATEILDARISGSGDVFYKGQPRIISKISGSGSLESRN